MVGVEKITSANVGDSRALLGRNENGSKVLLIQRMDGDGAEPRPQAI